MNQSANHPIASGVQDKLLESMKAALAEAEGLLRSAASATGAAAGAGGEAGSAQADAGGKDGDVVDAEFTEVKDKK